MTREQEAITYFEFKKKELEDFRKIYPSPDTVGYQATTKEISFYDMAISALEKNESAGEWYKLLCEKWDEGDLVYNFHKGMTNGEVMNLVLRKAFPRLIFIRGVNEYNKTKSIVYSDEWENAPYKGVSE